jgi:hypothetical protein
MTTTALDNEVLEAEATKGSSQRGRKVEISLRRDGRRRHLGSVGGRQIWSPELISGTDQTRVPIAAFTDWFYAVIATGLVLLAFSRRTPDLPRSSWAAFTLLISGIWLVVAITSIWTPDLISDDATCRAGRRSREPDRRCARYRVRFGLRCRESERNG